VDEEGQAWEVEMANIYWRNGWAWARATVKGVERREPLGTRSKAEAQEYFEQFVAKIAAEKASNWTRKETPFREAVRVFTDDHLPTLKVSSQGRYLQSLIELTPHFEGMTLQRISRGDLTTFVAARRKGGVKDSTIRRDLACLSSVFTIAADYELCDANPVLPFLRNKKKVKQLLEADFRTRHLSHMEELRLLRQARAEAEALPEGTPRWHEKFMLLCGIALYIDVGLRAQELLMAEWSWVDLEMQAITVPASVAKSGKARTVPLVDRAMAILEHLPRHPTSPYVLWRCKTGKRFMDINKAIQRIARAADITDLHVHDLRRTCGCRLLQDWRMSMAKVSKWLGHASTEITEKRYAFLKVENLQEAIGRLQNPDIKLQVGSFFGAPRERTNIGTHRFYLPDNKGE
jgi:integrase